MDGFDDLLAPTREALEDNPFEDPFAKPRSNSPDPWASYNPVAAEHTSGGFRSATPTSPTLESQGFQDALGFSTYGVQHHDPLVSTPSSEPQSPTSPTPVRSPGFKESIPAAAEETPQPPESLSNFFPPSQPSSSTSVSSPPLVRAQSPPLAPVSPAPAPATTLAPSAATRPDRPFESPLDTPPGPVLDRPFASLTLGGESLGGWQGAQSAFGGGQPVYNTFSSDTQHSNQNNQLANNDDDDDDDDKPILQSLHSRTHSGASMPSIKTQPPPAPRTENGIQPTFVITVDDPQRVGDPIRAFTMYTVHTRTTSPLFSKSSFSVLRRYSDFLWIYETLSLNNPGVVVPPVPEKNPFGRFDDSFVQQRRLALEKCIRKIANHPVLQKDPDLRMFLESDTFALDIKQRKAEIAHEKGGLMATIGQTIAGARFYETDEWFDRQKAYLDSLETQLRGLVKAIDLVVKHRSELAVTTGEFAQAISDLSESDLGKPLQNALAGLAKVERKVEEQQNAQSQEDVITIMSTVDEYTRLINSVRLAFSSRVRTYHLWQNADSNVKRVKQMHESNRNSGRIPSDQLGRSLNVVAEAERRALDAKQDFDQCSRLVKTEVARFEQERIEDFKASLEAFLDGMITRQKQLISALETYQETLLKKVSPANQRATATVS